jgi:hypothetical protein
LALRRMIYIKKYKINGNYTALNEFLAIADRESRNIALKEAVTTRKAQANVTFNSHDARGILKKEGWRATSPTPATMAWRPPTPTHRLSPEVRPRSPSPAPFLRRPESPVPPPAPRDVSSDTCLYCSKTGHWASDCPKRRRDQALDKSISELVVGEKLESDELSKNS